MSSIHVSPGTSEATFRLVPQRTRPFTIGTVPTTWPRSSPRGWRSTWYPTHPSAQGRAERGSGLRSREPGPSRSGLSSNRPTCRPKRRTFAWYPIPRPPRDERSDVPVGAPENQVLHDWVCPPNGALCHPAIERPTRNGPAWGRGRSGDGGEGKPRDGRRDAERRRLGPTGWVGWGQGKPPNGTGRPANDRCRGGRRPVRAGEGGWTAYDRPVSQTVTDAEGGE